MYFVHFCLFILDITVDDFVSLESYFQKFVTLERYAERCYCNLTENDIIWI